MANQIVNELRTTTDAVWARLSAQLHAEGAHSAVRAGSGHRRGHSADGGLPEATPLVTAT